MARNLTPKQQAFITHYLACLRGAYAARLAGYAAKYARQQSYENMRKAHIKIIIDAELERRHQEWEAKRQADIDALDAEHELFIKRIRSGNLRKMYRLNNPAKVDKKCNLQG